LATHEPLDASFWHRITEAFERDDGAFQAFLQRLVRDSRRVRCRTSACKAEWMLTLRTARSEYGYEEVHPHHPWRRSIHEEGLDDEEENPHKGGCSGAAEGTRAMLQSMVRTGTNQTALHSRLSALVQQRTRPSWRIWRRAWA